MKFRLAGIQEVRDTLGPVADRACYGAEFTTITRRTRPVAAIVSPEWAAFPDRMAAELLPMAECSAHPVLAGEDPEHCRACSIRRVCLDYLTAAGHADPDRAVRNTGWMRLPQRNQDGTVYQPGQEK